MHAPLALIAIGLLPLVAGHCKITKATGDLGGNGTALGITANDGNSESDVTVFSGANAKTFGDTPGGGNINPATALPAAIALSGSTLPQVSVGGAVTMNLHQVNADGAGPFTCSVDPTAVGNAFVAMTVTTNVAGTKGVSTASNADFPLVAAMPASVTACTGTVGGITGVCMVKCQNPTGPFGGTVAVQLGGSGAATSSTNTTAAEGSTGSTSTGSTGTTTTGSTGSTTTGSTGTTSTGSTGTTTTGSTGGTAKGSTGSTAKGSTGSTSSCTATKKGAKTGAKEHKDAAKAKGTAAKEARSPTGGAVRVRALLSSE